MAAKDEAEQTTEEIERKVGGDLPPPKGTLKVRPRKVFGFGLILGAMLGKNRAQLPGAVADGGAGVPVQRGVLYLWAGADEILPYR